MPAKIAVLQLNSGPQVSENLKTVERLLIDAVNTDVRLAALPENFALMPRDDGDRVRAAETPGSGPVQDFLRAQAQRHRLWVVAGTVPLRSNDARRVRAACLVYDDRGTLAARYDKIHLFDVVVDERESYRESEYIEPGPLESNQVVVDTPVGRMGLAVCYDLRFPELFRGLSQRGCEMFVIPSAFTATTGRAHWEVLLRARAVENLSYVLAPAQCGTHANGRKTFGHSVVVGPWGEVIVDLPDGEGVITAEIKRDYVDALRRKFPSLDHRRL